MRVLIALGGNALLRRGEAMTPGNQRNNIRRAAKAIADIITAGHQVVITHGNGPQVGLLALQAAAYSAEIGGMIGYVLQQELYNLFGEDKEFATLLTQIEVDAKDPAFLNPTKPIGPIYTKSEADTLGAARGWTMKPDGDGWSPRPRQNEPSNWASSKN